MPSIIDKIKFRINKLIQKDFVVPDMVEKRKVIEHFVERFQPECFIETGTFLGDTIEFFKDKFDSIVSVELSEELANKAMKRFKNDKNVMIVQGDSSIELPKIISNLTGYVLFWLDGHYSSEFFIRDEYIKTAKGEKNTPIEKELEIILSSSVIPVILIDDARLFNGKSDYPSIKEIKQQLNLTDIKFDIFVNKDIIHIIPQNK